MDYIKVRFLRDGDGGVFAYFPDEDAGCGCRMSYAHVGQHSACSTDYADECEEATEAQARQLREEVADLYMGGDTPTLIVILNDWRDYRLTRADIRMFYRETEDRGDKWGSAVGFLFSICDVLMDRNDSGDEIDRALGRWLFRPGAGVSDGPDEHPADDYLYWELRSYPTAVLVRFGDVLSRYSDSLRDRGESY